MDGNQLLRQLRDILQESSVSGWLDDFTSYDYIWRGAVEFASRTESFKSSQTITTIQNTSNYRLNADFLKLFAKTSDNRYFLKLNDGSSDDHYLFHKDHAEILYQPTQTAVQFPFNFTLIPDPSPLSSATGVTTSTGAASGGQCTLTDSGAAFSDYAAGDTVENTTDGSTGIILSVTSGTQLVTALFGGTNNSWGLGDSYQVIPQGRMIIVLDPPPSTSAYTISIPYIQRPAPVFSSYGSYQLQREYCLAILMYAAWLYKYRDSKQDSGDKCYVHFDNQVKRYAYGVNARMKSSTSIRVNFKARR